MNIKEIEERRPAGARAGWGEMGEGRHLRAQAPPGLAEGASASAHSTPVPAANDRVHLWRHSETCNVFPRDLSERRCKHRESCSPILMSPETGALPKAPPGGSRARPEAQHLRAQWIRARTTAARAGGGEGSGLQHRSLGLWASGERIGLPCPGQSPGSFQLLTPRWGQDPNAVPLRAFLSGVWHGNWQNPRGFQRKVT